MFYLTIKQFQILIVFIFFIISSKSLFSQEKATTFFGPYYRSNQYLPLIINHQDDFNAIYIENKYSRDSLIFNQDKKAEALVKIFADGTLFALKDKKNDKKILNLSFRILPEETPLIVIASDLNQTIETENSRIKVSETKILPSYISSYDMIEILWIKDSYLDTLTTKQTEAIKEWVLSGGIIIFESKLTLKKHAGLAVPLLKQSNSKLLAATSNVNIEEELNNEAIKISAQTTITPTGYGFMGIKSFSADSFKEDILKYCNGQIEWRIRNRNNSLAEKNSLKQEVSSTKIQLTQKVTVIYFLLFMIFAFLKIKNYYARVACGIASISIIPVVLLTPMNHLDSHYYQLLDKKVPTEFARIKEEVYLRQGNIPEITINIENSKPFFVNDSSKVVFEKNIQGQYMKQTIESSQEYVILKKTSISKNLAFEKFQKDQSTFLYHKFPLENIYEVSASTVNSMRFNIETTSKDGVITKLIEPIETKPRENFEKKSWYATSNQLFSPNNYPPESILIIEGSTRLIPMGISPDLTIQKSFFSYISIPEPGANK